MSEVKIIGHYKLGNHININKYRLNYWRRYIWKSEIRDSFTYLRKGQFISCSNYIVQVAIKILEKDKIKE